MIKPRKYPLASLRLADGLYDKHTRSQGQILLVHTTGISPDGGYIVH